MTKTGAADLPDDAGPISGPNGGPKVRLPNVLGLLLAENRPIVMGVLNITPDSFSDGGQFVDPGTALRHAKRMIEEGADIIDIGAESTRPYGGAKPVTLEEELARLQPVLPAVVQLGIPTSIDTIKPEVAFWAIGQGVRIVNDVWGLQRDPNMASIIGQHGVPVVIMHNRHKAEPTIDIVSDINAFFDHSLDIASKAGIPRDAIALDPGIGFGKSVAHSVALLAATRRLAAIGRPLLVGASRKRFLGILTGEEDPERRHVPGLAAAAIAAFEGAAVLRVHDVAATVRVVRIADAARDARG